MSVSKYRLLFNITFILLFFALFLITYPAIYSSFFIIFTVTGIFITIGFFMEHKSKKMKRSLFVISFVLFFSIILLASLASY